MREYIHERKPPPPPPVITAQLCGGNVLHVYQATSQWQQVFGECVISAHHHCFILCLYFGSLRKGVMLSHFGSDCIICGITLNVIDWVEVNFLVGRFTGGFMHIYLCRIFFRNFNLVRLWAVSERMLLLWWDGEINKWELILLMDPACDAMNRSNANTQHAHGFTNPMLLFSFSIMYIVLGNRQSVYCEHHNYIYISPRCKCTELCI